MVEGEGVLMGLSKSLPEVSAVPVRVSLNLEASIVTLNCCNININLNLCILFALSNFSANVLALPSSNQTW